MWKDEGREKRGRRGERGREGKYDLRLKDLTHVLKEGESEGRGREGK